MENLRGTRILVSGGAGFVGSRLVRRLLETGAAEIHVVDNLLSAERGNLPDDPRVRFDEASIADDALLTTLRDEYDFLFHLATYHGNQSSIHDPLADHANNTLTTLKLYDRVKRFTGLKKVVYASAGCAIAEKTSGPAQATEETDLVSLHQDSPYSMSKVFGEFYSNYYSRQHGLPVVRARFQNVYGPGEILGAGRWRGTPATVWRNVTPTFIYKALKGQPLPVENQGAATRDFIYVDDVVTGLVACAGRGNPGQAYNIASGRETSILELANRINAFTGNAAGIEFQPGRPWDRSGRRFGSGAKARETLEFEVKVGLDDGLIATIIWTRDHLGLIEGAIAKHAQRLQP